MRRWVGLWLLVSLAPDVARAQSAAPAGQTKVTEENVPAPVDDFLRQQAAESAEAVKQKEAAAAALKELERARAELDEARLRELKTQAGKLVARVESRLSERKPPARGDDFSWLSEMQAAAGAHGRAKDQLGSLRTRVGALERTSSLATAAQESSALEQLATLALAELDRRDQAMDAAVESVKRSYLKNQALVVSGGISLGNHQAGFLYYYTLHLKSSAERVAAQAHDPSILDTGRFRIATGASAGSINSLLALVVGCMPAQYTPEQSPFFWVWNDVGIGELARPAEVAATGIFSRAGIVAAVNRVEHLLAAKNSGFPAKCDSILGVTATRMTPRTVSYEDGGAEAAAETRARRGARPSTVIGLKRQTEKFVLSLNLAEGAREGEQFKNFRLSDQPFVQEIYPTLGDHHARRSPLNAPATRADVMRLVQASASFPVAFEPMALPTTVWKRTGTGSNNRPSFERPLYTDGGFLDNTPLELAYKIATTAQSAEPPVLFLKSDGVLWGKPPAKSESRVLARQAAPEAAPGDVAPEPAAASIFGAFLPFLFELINGASDGQLVDTLEKGSMKNLERRIPGRRMPITADFLTHFGAFLDKDFRRFDFYQGMADAFDYLETNAGTARDHSLRERLGSPVFECFLEYRKGLGDSGLPALTPACKSTLGANLVALLESSGEHMRAVEGGKRSGAEVAPFLASLHQRGFRYSALAANQPLTDLEVAQRLRDVVQALAGPLRNRQGDELSKLGASLLGKTIPNELVYRAASYCGVGFIQGAEISCSRVFGRYQLLGGSLALRATPVLRYFRPSAVWPSFARLDDRAWTVTMTTGAAAQVEIAPWPSLQLELGGGWDFHWRWKSAFAGSFGGLVPSRFMMRRDGPLAIANLVFFQRLYLTYSRTFFRDGCALDNGCDNIAPAFRSYAEPLAVDNYDQHLSIGVRFLF